MDQYVRTENQRLNFVRNNQQTLRAECYAGYMDAVDRGERSDAVGKRVILPSSFTGGPRYMGQIYQDSMAGVRCNGKPDLFITMTCNPNWPDLQAALLPGQEAA